MHAMHCPEEINHNCKLEEGHVHTAASMEDILLALLQFASLTTNRLLSRDEKMENGWGSPTNTNDKLDRWAGEKVVRIWS